MFSVWHILLVGVQLVVVAAVVGVIAYFLLRKTAASSPTSTPDLSENGTAPASHASASPRSTVNKLISVVYLIGGLFGVITTLPQLNGVSLDLMSALAWLILLAQIFVAIYGGWQFWNHRPIGVQLLYWLSWSCVPVISFSLLSYWCAMGLAFFPTVELSLGSFRTDFSLRFGYASELWFNTGNSSVVLGCNAVALMFVFLLAKVMRDSRIPTWPLVRPAAQVSANARTD